MNLLAPKHWSFSISMKSSQATWNVYEKSTKGQVFIVVSFRLSHSCDKTTWVFHVSSSSFVFFLFSSQGSVCEPLHWDTLPRRWKSSHWCSQLHGTVALECFWYLWWGWRAVIVCKCSAKQTLTFVFVLFTYGGSAFQMIVNTVSNEFIKKCKDVKLACVQLFRF